MKKKNFFIRKAKLLFEYLRLIFMPAPANLARINPGKEKWKEVWGWGEEEQITFFSYKSFRDYQKKMRRRICFVLAIFLLFFSLSFVRIELKEGSLYNKFVAKGIEDRKNVSIAYYFSELIAQTFEETFGWQ